MTEAPFLHHRPAALRLLCDCPDIPHKAAGFLGHVAVADLLTDKQGAWLATLLSRHNLPPLAEGVTP